MRFSTAQGTWLTNAYTHDYTLAYTKGAPEALISDLIYAFKDKVFVKDEVIISERFFPLHSYVLGVVP